MLHGFSHEYRKINGRWEPECIWKSGERLNSEFAKGKEYLEELLETKIKVFVPPGNRIGKKGIEAIERANLNLSGILGPWGDRLFTLAYLKAWMRRWNYWIWHKEPYPYVLDFGKHKELVAYSLTLSTNWEKLLKRLKLCAKIRAPFVIATHYWEVCKHQELKDKLYQLVEIALDLGAIPVKVSECYG